MSPMQRREEASRETAGKHRPGREPVAPPKADVTTTKLDAVPQPCVAPPTCTRTGTAEINSWAHCSVGRAHLQQSSQQPFVHRVRFSAMLCAEGRKLAAVSQSYDATSSFADNHLRL